MRILIIDDEPVARQTIRVLLQKDSSVKIAGECSNGAEGLAFLAKHSVDLIFLDVQMPGMTGFDMLAKLDSKTLPIIIFVTAFDKFALRAFDVHAFDYLLKPFDDDRFYNTLDRARQYHAKHDVAEASKRLIALLEEMKNDSAAGRKTTHGEKEYVRRFMIRSTGRVVMVDIDDVEYIEADGDYARLIVQNKPHLLREKISELEHQLNPALFVRTHRSYIIRIDLIKELKPQVNGDYRITLTNGKQLPLSRTYREHVLSILQKNK